MKNFKEYPKMASDCIRLHFWSKYKSCYVVTDCIAEAANEMFYEYDEYDIAANQNLDIQEDDIELYYFN